MAKQKFTVFLMPLDEGGYQAFFPYYPNCVTDGRTVAEALKNAQKAMEGILQVEAEQGGDAVPGYVHASHGVVSEVEVQIPDSLIEPPQKTSKITG